MRATYSIHLIFTDMKTADLISFGEGCIVKFFIGHISHISLPVSLNSRCSIFCNLFFKNQGYFLALRKFIFTVVWLI